MASTPAAQGAAVASAAAAAANPPPPPPGLNYVSAIQPSLDLLLIGTVWSAFLIPVAIALFFFSTPFTRRQPVFVMNVLAILFGLTEGAVNIYNQTRAILAKPVSPDLDTAFAFMCILVPMFAELILLFRVVAVWPPRALSWRARLAVYVPVVAFKVARIVNDAMFIAKWVQLKRHTVDPLLTGQEAWSLPNAKVEWFLQFFDTMWAVRLVVLSIVSYTLSSRLRTLFWIAVSNFVLPVLLNLAQLIFVFRDSSFLHGTYVFLVNTYVQILGVLLATIWSTGTQWSELASRGAHADGGVSELRFVASASRSGGSADVEGADPDAVGRSAMEIDLADHFDSKELEPSEER
ncbi:hypothetical protein C8Q79DRAFT_1003985 [Trametes meyenii]|nr:hypothetical protein C8Q79DRAFT_1003985 [Trametes meyenii]